MSTTITRKAEARRVGGIAAKSATAARSVLLIDLCQSDVPPLSIVSNWEERGPWNQSIKTLANSTGHTVDACQGIVEVHAPSQERAINEARTEFAELKEVTAWWLRADYAKAELLPSRRRVIRRNQLLPMRNP